MAGKSRMRGHLFQVCGRNLKEDRGIGYSHGIWSKLPEEEVEADKIIMFKRLLDVYFERTCLDAKLQAITVFLINSNV